MWMLVTCWGTPSSVTRKFSALRPGTNWWVLSRMTLTSRLTMRDVDAEGVGLVAGVLDLGLFGGGRSGRDVGVGVFLLFEDDGAVVGLGAGVGVGWRLGGGRGGVLGVGLSSGEEQGERSEGGSWRGGPDREDEGARGSGPAWRRSFILIFSVVIFFFILIMFIRAATSSGDSTPVGRNRFGQVSRPVPDRTFAGASSIVSAGRGYPAICVQSLQKM